MSYNTDETAAFFEAADCYQGDRDAWEALWNGPRDFGDDATLAQDDYEFMTQTGRYAPPEAK